MRRSIFALTVAILLVTGSSAGSGASAPFLWARDSSALPPLTQGAVLPGWLSPGAKSGGGLLYVSGGVSSSEVAIFRQKGNNQPPLGEITLGLDGAFGLFVDKQRNLCVANLVNGTVTVYPPGNTAPSQTLTGAGAPLSVVVSRDGTVFVASEGSVNGPPRGSVLEYLKGHTKPSKTIVAFGNETFPSGLALDSADNLYVAFNQSQGASFGREGQVLEFSPSSLTGRNLGIGVGHTGGLTIDKSNDLVLVDQGNGRRFPPAIDVFRPGKTSPFKRLLANGCPGIGVALNHDNTEIWAVCPWHGTIFGLTYPAGQVVDTITPRLGWAFGVATSPDGSE